MAKIKDFRETRKKWLSDPLVKREYESLKKEFQIAEEIIRQEREHI